MANDVFANGREISCKSAAGKSICAFPDVVFTPPLTPPMPLGIPIPYPNTGFAKDTTAGSKRTKITKKEIILKNKSHFKKSIGDIPGKTSKKGLITSKTTGKVYFNSWSMNVKVESENVVRHIDITTHNHGSFPGNSPPWAYTDSSASEPIKGCETEVDNAETACRGKKTKKSQCKSKKCRDAKRCLLVTYNQGKREGADSQVGCCDGEQPHHLVEAHCFYEAGNRGESGKRIMKAPPGKRIYNDSDSPCVCAKGPRDSKEHGQYHAIQSKLEAAHHEKNGSWKYKDAREAGVKANKAVNPQCSEGCTSAQLDAYHKDRCGVKDNSKLRTDPEAGTRSCGKLDSDQVAMLKKAVKKITGRNSSSSST